MCINSWWMFVSNFSYSEYSCYEHLNTSVCVVQVFISIGYQSRISTAGSYGKCIFKDIAEQFPKWPYCLVFLPGAWEFWLLFEVVSDGSMGRMGMLVSVGKTWVAVIRGGRGWCSEASHSPWTKTTLVTLSQPPRSQLVCLLLLSDQELPEGEGQTLFLTVVSDPSMSGHSRPWDALVGLNSKYVS